MHESRYVKHGLGNRDLVNYKRHFFYFILSLFYFRKKYTIVIEIILFTMHKQLRNSECT